MRQRHFCMTASPMRWREESMADQAGGIEAAVWDALRTIFDPEIPVDIVELGLIYSCRIIPLDAGKRVEITMTLTAPGCAMADVIKAEVERKLAQIAGVTQVSVAVVFDPPWDKSRMSDEAKLQLGFDLDYAPPSSALPIWKQK
jgi:FeS assembly SUF system protein